MEGSSAQAICSRRLRRGQIVRALAQLARSRRRRRRERKVELLGALCQQTLHN